MDQNSHKNTKGNETFFNGNNTEFDIYSHFSNIRNDLNATYNNNYNFPTTSVPVLNATDSNNAGIEQAFIQNPFMDISSSLSLLPVNSPNMNLNSPLMPTRHSGIIRYEIPGYDVIFIPKYSPFAQQDCNFLLQPIQHN